MDEAKEGAGKNPKGEEDPEACLSQHPDLARELKELFRTIRIPGSDKADGRDASSHRILGDFRIIREIGSGGMARVFEAEQLSLRRRVALKVLPPHLSFSERVVKRFHREAEAGGRQNHPGIVTVYEMGEYDGVQYIAQELVKNGRTLAQHLEEFKSPEDLPRGYFHKTALLIADVADALEDAHSRGVTHSDVKPSNILITPAGRPKVVDFGFARVEDALALSQSGEISGTPYYMSPEQAEGRRKEIDHRTDIYSLGVTLYEALSLERPFDGDVSQEVIKKILLHEPCNPRRTNPRVHTDLAVICLKAMEKDPNHRYQTMAEMSQDLRRYIAGEPIMARPAGWIRRSCKWIRRHRLRSLAGTAVLIALVSVAVLAYAMTKQYQEDLAIAQQRCKPPKEAFDWDNLDRYGIPWKWCIDADPGEPAGYMLKALYSIGSVNLEVAARDLDACIKRCGLRGMASLEEEAHYLKSLVDYRRAERSYDPQVKVNLLREAAAELKAVGEFDPLSPELFVWRHDDGTGGLDGDKPWYQRRIKVNESHYLVSLYRGIYLFQILYKGGEQGEYEEAVGRFKNVLDRHPCNVAALCFLGRVQYFFARHYNYLHLLKEASRHLQEALRCSRESVYPLIYTTLGQIGLLEGNFDGARDFFHAAIRAAKDSDFYLHNDHRGLGDILARCGKLDEALLEYHAARSVAPRDPHIGVALAELAFMKGNFSLALDRAGEALAFHYSDDIEIETRLASAYLISARVHLREKRNDQAEKDLKKIRRIAIRSPRDMSLACFLLATFPAEISPSPEEEQKRNDRMGLAKALAGHAAFLTEESPICLSAQGAAALLQGKYHEVIDACHAAMEERKKWPELVQEYYWRDRARDLYFLAMAHSRLYGENPTERGADRDEAITWYEQAEALFEEKYSPFEEYADVLVRVRNRAREMLE